jgi:heptosyltransferase-2/heptosyltransferase-3
MRRWRELLRLALLRLFGLLSRPWMPSTRSPLRSDFRVLLIRPDHLGDLLFLTPALRVMRQNHPDAHLTLMVGPWSVPAVANNTDVDELRVCEFPGFTRQPKGRFWEPYAVLWRQSRELRRERFDLAMVYRFDHWWGALLAYMSRIPRRIGYDIPECYPFLTQAEPYRPNRHEVLQNLSLSTSLEEKLTGQDEDAFPGSPPLRFPVSREELARAKALLLDAGADANVGMVCMHPGTGALVKMWNTADYAQTGDALVEEYGLRAVITGSPSEMDMAYEIAGQMRTDPVVLAGKTTLALLAAVMQQCRLVLGPDSGPLHLAVAVGTSSVHLYGPVDPRRFGPWGNPSRHIVVTSGMECIPCNRLDYAAGELPEHPCVRCVEKDQVLNACRQLLSAQVSG